MGGQSQGSWFPSGYHGHFRSKPRSDFTNRYRQESKPPPPQQFVRRIQERPTSHNFSHHDNRFSFSNTVSLFQNGLGKKKVTNRNTSRFHPDFIAWVPHKKEIERGGPHISIYRDTHKGTDPQALTQTLVESIRKHTGNNVHRVQSHPRKVLETPYSDPECYDTDPLESTYRYAHSHAQPNPEVNTNMSTGRIEPTQPPMEITNRYINPRVPSIYEEPRRLTRRSRVSSAPVTRSSVAQCLVWHDCERLPDTVRRPKTAMAAVYTSELDGDEVKAEHAT